MGGYLVSFYTGAVDLIVFAVSIPRQSCQGAGHDTLRATVILVVMIAVVVVIMMHHGDVFMSCVDVLAVSPRSARLDTSWTS